MKKKLEKKVKKHMAKKKSFLLVGITYIGIALILLIISSQSPISSRFWINFPSFILLFVLSITYVSMFGLRKMEDSLYDEEDEIEEAVARLYEYKTRDREPRLDLNEEEKLELIELEKLKERVRNS
jgi:hypothetical protein